jgi:imidazolonepropionase-like amidohydrolase
MDVSGKYIIPGLMDANVHLIPWPSWEYIEFLARYENNFEGIIEEAAQVALKHGFTTMFDSMGPLRPLMHVRDRIAKGEIEGTRMYVAGDIVGFRAVFTTSEAMKSASKAFQARINDLFEAGGGPDLAWLPPAQVKDEMRKYVAQGVDFVKYGATGDGRPTNSEIGQNAVLRFSPAQQSAMVEAVHEAGKIIQTHQTSAEAIRIVLEVGVDIRGREGTEAELQADGSVTFGDQKLSANQWGLKVTKFSAIQIYSYAENQKGELLNDLRQKLVELSGSGSETRDHEPFALVELGSPIGSMG